MSTRFLTYIVCVYTLLLYPNLIIHRYGLSAYTTFTDLEGNLRKSLSSFFTTAKLTLTILALSCDNPNSGNQLF